MKRCDLCQHPSETLGPGEAVSGVAGAVLCSWCWSSFNQARGGRHEWLRRLLVRRMGDGS